MYDLLLFLMFSTNRSVLHRPFYSSFASLLRLATYIFGSARDGLGFSILEVLYRDFTFSFGPVSGIGIHDAMIPGHGVTGFFTCHFGNLLFHDAAASTIFFCYSNSFVSFQMF